MDVPRWTEEVDDLVDAGEVDGAISLLESVVSNLSTAASPSGADLRLATALGDLAGLHASCGKTLRADELRARARAIVLRSRAAAHGALGDHDLAEKSSSQGNTTVVFKHSEASANSDETNEDDDWEVIADRGAHDDTLVRSLEHEARVSSCSSPEKTTATSSSGPKRRGRGSFLYDKSVLYSDQCGSERDLDDKVSSPQSGLKSYLNDRENKATMAAAQFGTRHALVLYDFSPNTRTTDLEKIFEKFGDHGVTIRWVNDTSALAVFQSPSAASEAQACIPSRFKVRALKEEDDVLTKIGGTDLEPPKPRPKTSARTAQRLIAHGMGLKQFSNFGSDQLKKQEEERRNRITARQALCDEAWGSD